MLLWLQIFCQATELQYILRYTHGQNLLSNSCPFVIRKRHVYCSNFCAFYYIQKSAKGELGHANRIAKRIAELGGEPLAAMADIEKLAGFGKVSFPKKRSDITGFVKIFLEMERHAIAIYNDLATKTHGKDLVTHELAEGLLAE